MDSSDEGAGYDIAIVGMAVRVPGASDPDQYWKNLRDGVESVQFYSDEELAERGVRPEQLKNPHYVKAGAPLNDVAGFDPEFFGFSPKEAGILDPQHRQFYECAWEALERASHVPEQFDGAIGVFAGCGMGAYFAYNILSNPDLLDSVGLFLLRHTGNDKDFLTTRASYSFNLKGPSINVQTACSTSAVATHMACQSLMSGECDMALAGGVTIEIPHQVGYIYKEGEILSPDGHCRPFDHRSKGTIFGSGTGVVVLRRLEDALEDGDHIHAVIAGSAINNDGSSKVGYLAPSVEGQAQAITEALALTDLSADNIDYVECHGTGTPVGDPIEVAALDQAFRQTTDRNGFCGLGSVKSNIGHLDTAAGVASIIKTTLALEHGQLPPSLNYEAPNPTIDFVNSPFYVNDSLKEWPKTAGRPRRAAVNSLGVGGTNAFIILEQPPAIEPSPESNRRCQLLVVSARNRNALDDACQRLAGHLREHPEQSLADIAYTLFVGRKSFEHRRIIACVDHEEAIALLESNDPKRVSTHRADEDQKSVVFMFPGGGAQYVTMAHDLYQTEAVFRQHFDAGLEALKQRSDIDLKALLFAEDANPETLQAPSIQLPAIFIIEYALAQLWMSLGIEPKALIGHSMGENTAACLAGVISYRDAIGLVHLRGTLMDGVPEGGMLSVQLPANELEKYIGAGSSFPELELASVNSPGLSVASGPVASLDKLAQKLTADTIESQRVKINIAAHSSMLDGILEEFGNYLRSIKLNAPSIPFISNRTGDWITKEQATDPNYWVGHLRNTVQFAKGIDTLLKEEGRVFLEVGPGNTLGSLTRQNPNAPAQRVFSSLRHPDEKVSDDAYFLSVLGRLWAVGVTVSSTDLWPEGGRHRIPLPTYAFQHKDYWIKPGKLSDQKTSPFAQLEKIEKFDNWFKQPTWIQQGILPSSQTEACTWLAFIDNGEVINGVISRLQAAGHKVITIREGDAYYQISPEEYRLSPEAGSEGYSALISDLVANGTTPNRILHSWLLTEQESFRPGSSFFHRNQEYGFYSLFFLAKALAEGNLIDDEIHLTVISNGMQQVRDEILPYPEKATVLGPCKVIPREFAGITCSSVDITLPESQSSLFGKAKNNDEAITALIDSLVIEVQTTASNSAIAYRNDVRWEQCFDRLPEAAPQALNRLKEKGIYLITGGLGGIGFVMAKHLAANYAARLVLVNRTPLPARLEWSDWLKQHSHDDAISRNIRRVKELEDSGADVLILSGNVTDVDRMKQIVEEAKEYFGAINGVLHAAGTVQDNLIQIKTQSEAEEVFTPKVYGTLVLDKVFEKEALDFMVLFSSTSTAIAPVGQIDYVGANAFLNAYAQSQNSKHGNRYTVAINWGVWNEVGMAAESALTMGMSANKSVEQSETSEANYILFEKHHTISDGNRTRHIISAHISPKTHWLLDEHRTIGGQALLPGTAYIELIRAALEECGEKTAFEIRELIFFKALYIADDSAKHIRIKLRSSEEGYQFQLQSEQQLDDGNRGWETHAEARILIKSTMASDSTDLKEILDRCGMTAIDCTNTAAIKSKQEDHLNFGKRWQVLRQFSYGNKEAIAQLSLAPEFFADLEDFSLHPALLDLATGYAMELISGYSDGNKAANLWVPVSYGSFRFYHPLSSEIYSWVRMPRDVSVTDDFASFDITLYDSSGKILAEISQLTIHKLSGVVDFSKEKPSDNLEMEDQPAKNSELRQLSPSELAFQHNLSQGILPAEGTQALNHVLNSASSSQVIVSSLDLNGLIEEACATAASLQPETESASFSRPDLDNDFVEAKDDIERTLVGFWEELLGIDQVGVEDSFFDLGGHSLIAVRLFAKIQQTFDIDYPISILFEAPTITSCADLIRETLGDDANSEEGDQNKHQTRYTHLVPMHTGKPGKATPFFLVAGMFGNVLNLRHLAHLVGTDRAFYGLQARGLYGDHEPHGTFEEMAKDYIAEMKTVQAEGPYLLGGFSGGGITAFEIARQLLEAGDEVATLILLDTPLAHFEPLSSVDRMSIHWQRVRKQGAAYFTEWAKNRYQWELQKFSNRFNNAEEDSTPYDFQSEVIEVAFRKALDLYDTQYQPLNVTLFRPKLDKSYSLSGKRAANAGRELVYEDNGWTPYVKTLDVYEVPGDHDGMVLEPNVRVLATKMAQCIAAAEK